ncbi:glycosyl hydrolase family 28-related protein [Microbulbifer sp. VTAC004]|uniref:glycosyl hydrolase family 28-related protein n=1 Tax=unclassified Microbulbifer TaxID=2619833 RepID=UPI004039B22B
MENKTDNRRRFIKRALGAGAASALATTAVHAGTTSTPNSYLSDGSGASSRDLGGKLNDFVSVKDFGAKGDHYTDDTASIENALNYISSVVNASEGGTLYFPKGVYTISRPLVIPNKTHIVGEGISSVIRAHEQNFSGDCILRLGSVNGNAFDTQISNLRIHQNKASVGKSIVYSNAMNQQCGLFNVLLDGLENVDGIVFDGENSGSGGPSIVEVRSVNIQAISNITNGIHSAVGGMILKVSHVTIEAANENSITRGIYMERDILSGDTLHFEGCSNGIVIGTKSLGGKGSVITGSRTTGTLVAITSTFERGGIVLECLEHSSLVANGLIALQNNQNGDQIVDQFVTSYTYTAT